MKKMENKTHIEGLLYESTLQERTAEDDGRKSISGKLSIQISETNIVDVDIFEGEITKAGTKNKKYDTLKSLIGANSVVNNGADNATKIKIDSALSVRDWYFNGQAGTTLRNLNGFIHIVPTVQPNATFEVDMLITSTTEETKKEGDEIVPTGALIVNGFIFDFAKKIMPVKFVVDIKEGVEYFSNLEPNTLTKVWGEQVTQQDKTSKTEKSAFGADKVVEYVTTKKKLIITGTNEEPYEFGEENILTVDEVKKALADRNVYLETVKTRAQEKTAPTNNTKADFGW